MTPAEPYSVDKLTAEARRLAAEYRRATGKTLPLTAEIAVNDARRLLGLEEPPATVVGCDAVRGCEPALERIQIKGRVLFTGSKSTPRVGQINLDSGWDETVLVLMDEDYEPREIYSASRAAIEQALEQKPVNKRGAITVAQFRVIGRLMWSAEAGGRPDDAS